MKKPWISLTALFISSCIAALSSYGSPESDSARIAGNLRAFSDEDWAKIAGDRASEKYEVSRGDTLWDISERLFGDAKVWPKIWEINNTTILNPHMIEPRMGLVFNGGTGLSLPTLAMAEQKVNNAGTTTVKNHYVLSKDDRPGAVWDERTPYPSKEWKNLPRQSWENVEVALPANIDRDGFDTRNRVYLRKPATGLELAHYVACEPVKPVGTVEGTRSVTTYVYRGSEITIKAAPGQKLEANTVYTILDTVPSELVTKERRALSYDVAGKVKILGVQNGVYVGEIQTARDTVARGALLVPEIKRIEHHEPVAGPSKVKGTILADRRTGAFMSGQYKWVYIDRGTKDGVEPGMIFRIFQNQDPLTDKPLTNGDVFVSGDAQVIQGCDGFSIGMFLWSRGEVPEQYSGVLLTDMADQKIRFYFNGEASDVSMAEPPAPNLQIPEGIVDQPKPEPTEAIIGPGPTDHPDEPLAPPAPSEESDALTAPTDLAPEQKTAEEEDWLDKLDNHKELQSDEENELRELEKFHETQKAEAPTAPAEEGSDLPPPPDDSGLPPPPPEASALPPPPDEEFPSTEPVVETPSTLVKPPAETTAAAPKATPAPEEEAAPVDESSTEGLPPL